MVEITIWKDHLNPRRQLFHLLVIWGTPAHESQPQLKMQTLQTKVQQ